MKQILVIVLLGLLMAGCDSASPTNTTDGSGDYAQYLRDLANGQPGDQVSTEARPAPTMPPPPEQPRQVVKLPTPQVIATSQPAQPVSVAANIKQAAGFGVDDATVSLLAFITSPVAMFGFAATVAGLAVRRKVRK